MSKQIIYFKKSTKEEKKYMVLVGKKTIHFGSAGMSDYTIHKDPERKERYISRHKKRENWNKSGMTTAGFFSRWILWNKPTIRDSIIDTEERFNVKIKRGWIKMA
jgi:hypothetical protein